jgi:hypothetical protein
MMITIDWATKIIFVPQSFLAALGGARYRLDVDAFRNALKDIEDGEDGMAYPDTHRHATQSTLSGVVYARQVEVINGYTVTFESTGTQYQVECVGANHNILDVKNVNDVSLVIGNSAGLIAVNTGGSTGPTVAEIAAEVWSHISRTLTSAGAGGATAAEIRAELSAELTQITKVSKLHGVGVDLVVTPTTRTAGDLAQTIATVGDTVTVSAA